MPVMTRLPAALFAVIALALSACGDDNSGSSSAVSTPAPAAQGTGSDTGAATGATAIAMKGIAFVPKDITVKVGDTITWTNEDSVDHNVDRRFGRRLQVRRLRQGRHVRVDCRQGRHRDLRVHAAPGDGRHDHGRVGGRQRGGRGRAARSRAASAAPSPRCRRGAGARRPAAPRGTGRRRRGSATAARAADPARSRRRRERRACARTGGSSPTSPVCVPASRTGAAK